MARLMDAYPTTSGFIRICSEIWKLFLPNPTRAEYKTMRLCGIVTLPRKGELGYHELRPKVRAYQKAPHQILHRSLKHRDETLDIQAFPQSEWRRRQKSSTICQRLLRTSPGTMSPLVKLLSSQPDQQHGNSFKIR